MTVTTTILAIALLAMILATIFSAMVLAFQLKDFVLVSLVLSSGTESASRSAISAILTTL